VLTDDPDLRAVLETAQTRGFIGDGDLTPHVANALGFAAAYRSSRAAPLLDGELPLDTRQASETAPHQVLDLGSGGGLPGLVLARHWPDSRVVLLDANEQRTAFLAEAVDRLGWHDRVRVLRGRAELLAHEDEWRGAFDLVVARSFGPPAVVAECAAGFLAVGGALIVSEPPASPGSGDRWNHADELATLGLAHRSTAADDLDHADDHADDHRDDHADEHADDHTDEHAEEQAHEKAHEKAHEHRDEHGGKDQDEHGGEDHDAALPRPAGSFAVLTSSTACPDRYPRRVGIPAKRPLF